MESNTYELDIADVQLLMAERNIKRRLPPGSLHSLYMRDKPRSMRTWHRKKTRNEESLSQDTQTNTAQVRNSSNQTTFTDLTQPSQSHSSTLRRYRRPHRTAVPKATVFVTIPFDLSETIAPKTTDSHAISCELAETLTPETPNGGTAPSDLTDTLIPRTPDSPSLEHQEETPTIEKVEEYNSLLERDFDWNDATIEVVADNIKNETETLTPVSPGRDTIPSDTGKTLTHTTTNNDSVPYNLTRTLPPETPAGPSLNHPEEVTFTILHLEEYDIQQERELVWEDAAIQVMANAIAGERDD